MTATAMTGMPAELRSRDQWVLWRYETREGRATKVPYRAANPRARASTTDTATWASFDAATAAHDRGHGDGIGYVFSAEDTYTGIDLDRCVDEHGEMHPTAAGIVAALDGYTEVTPSGRGLHVLVRGRLTGDRHRTSTTAWGGDLEMYDRSRFFTMTGNGSGEIRDAQTEVDALYAEMFPTVTPPPSEATTPPIGDAPDDGELLARAFAASNGSKTRALYGGDTTAHGGDDSAADLALCGSLAFWTGPDPDRIDRLFRGSGLFREKWDSRRGESTYGRQTIARALQGRTDFYEWGRSRNGHTASAAEPAADRPLLVWASSVRSTSIRWAWTGRLAVGYLTVQTGIEGLGKSVFAAWLLARLTRGELEGEWEGTPANVLVVSGEDGISDTWRPRVELADADLDRTAFLNLDALGAGWDLRDGIAQLTAAVDQAEARVVFIDAALDHMPARKAGESINDPSFVRQAIAPLRTLTREREIVTVFSMHPPKARSGDFRDLVQASQAFTAIPRIGLLFAYHPDDGPDNPDRRRVLLRGKGNLGRDPGAIEFKVTGQPFTHDDGISTDRELVTDVQPSGVTIADLAPGRMIGTERKPSKTDRAATLIAAALADGAWHAADPIRDRLHTEEGANHNAVVTEAKRRLGVQSRKQAGTMNGGWEWQIAEESAGPPTREESREEGSTDSLTLPPRARDVHRLFDSSTNTPQNPPNERRNKESTFQNPQRDPPRRVSPADTSRARPREAPPSVDDDSLAAQAVRKYGAGQ